MLTGQLEKTFSGNDAWYGPSVMAAVRGVAPENRNSRVSDNTHSIAELVVHMLSWRNFVIQKLQGVEFEMTEELNFPKPGNWEEDVSKLQESQAKLLDALRAFPEEKLFEKVPGRKYDFSTLIHGILQHDIYHAGQISLINKSKA